MKSWKSYLLGTPGSLADVLAILEPGQNLLNDFLLSSGLLLFQALTTHAGLLLLVLKGLLDELDILQSQFLADDVQITSGVDIALDVNDLGVIEASNDLEDGIDGANVRQESVSETSTSGRATGQTSNIVDGQVGRDTGLGLVLLAQPVVSVIRDNDTSLFRVDGGIGEVL